MSKLLNIRQTDTGTSVFAPRKIQRIIAEGLRLYPGSDEFKDFMIREIPGIAE